MIYLFALSVAGSGIGNFFAHFFLSDMVAESIGWPAGSPFQLEIAFANLATGVLGIVAVGRRDGFREATVIAVTVFGVGATVVHLMDIVQTGNLAPGNTIQNVGNLLRPAPLIGFLAASRRAARGGESELQPDAFAHWRAPHANFVATVTGGLAMGFGIGLSMNQGLLGAALGLAGGVAIGLAVLTRQARGKE